MTYNRLSPRILRTTLRPDSSQTDILQPINLELLVTRNLAASWFHNMPGVQVQGVLHSLKVGATQPLPPQYEPWLDLTGGVLCLADGVG